MGARIVSWSAKISSIAGLLSAAEATWIESESVGMDDAFQWLQKRSLAFRTGIGSLYCVGNGASATMASHFAGDMAKNGGLMTRTLTDLATYTAYANDEGHDDVYAAQLDGHICRHDGLLCISSSGNSTNVVRAALLARSRGALVITVTAMSPENRLRSLGDLNLWTPATGYGDAESCHAAMLHHWTDLVVGV